LRSASAGVRGLDHLDEAELGGPHEGVDRPGHQICLQVADGAARDGELRLELHDAHLRHGGGALGLLDCDGLLQHAGAEGAERCLQLGLGGCQHVEVGHERRLAPTGVVTLGVGAGGAGRGGVRGDERHDDGEERGADGAAAKVHQAGLGDSLGRASERRGLEGIGEHGLVGRNTTQ
jgi:hypothetical protein